MAVADPTVLGCIFHSVHRSYDSLGLGPMGSQVDETQCSPSDERHRTRTEAVNGSIARNFIVLRDSSSSTKRIAVERARIYLDKS